MPHTKECQGFLATPGLGRARRILSSPCRWSTALASGLQTGRKAFILFEALVPSPACGASWQCWTERQSQGLTTVGCMWLRHHSFPPGIEAGKGTLAPVLETGAPSCLCRAWPWEPLLGCSTVAVAHGDSVGSSGTLLLWACFFKKLGSSGWQSVPLLFLILWDASSGGQTGGYTPHFPSALCQQPSLQGHGLCPFPTPHLQQTPFSLHSLSMKQHSGRGTIQQGS